MQKLWVMMVCVVSLVACGDKWDKAAKKMEELKTKMCACKDKACVDGVKKEEHDWEDSMKDTFKKDEKPPASFMEKAEKIDNESRECKKAVQKAAGAEKSAATMKAMTGFKDSMCACKDAACTTKVSEDMTKWSADQAKDASSSMGSMSEEDTKALTKVSEDMGKCMQTAMMGSAAPAPAAP